jgi:hypothetical protein
VTHGLSGRNVLLPGEDPAAFQALRTRLLVDLTPGTELEHQLLDSIAHNQHRLLRLAEWEARLMTEALEGDPSAPSRLMIMFSRSGDPSEALAKLHRYEASLRRGLHNAMKELRLSKSARHRANTVEASTTAADVRPLLERARAICQEIGLSIPSKPQIDNSNPIPGPVGGPGAAVDAGIGG